MTQVVVDVATKSVANQGVDEAGREQHGERDGEGGEEGQPAAKAHFSRSEYPTPRTVWIRRGSPPSSVLRRR